MIIASPSPLFTYAPFCTLCTPLPSYSYCKISGWSHYPLSILYITLHPMHPPAPFCILNPSLPLSTLWTLCNLCTHN